VFPAPHTHASALVTVQVSQISAAGLSLAGGTLQMYANRAKVEAWPRRGNQVTEKDIQRFLTVMQTLIAQNCAKADIAVLFKEAVEHSGLLHHVQINFIPRRFPENARRLLTQVN
jgi:hypothetical protein